MNQPEPLDSSDSERAHETFTGHLGRMIGDPDEGLLAVLSALDDEARLAKVPAIVTSLDKVIEAYVQLRCLIHWRETTQTVRQLGYGPIQVSRMFATVEMPAELKAGLIAAGADPDSSHVARCHDCNIAVPMASYPAGVDWAVQHERTFEHLLRAQQLYGSQGDDELPDVEQLMRESGSVPPQHVLDVIRSIR